MMAMPNWLRLAACGALLMAACLLLPACKTRGPAEEAAAGPEGVVQFTPVQDRSPLYAQEGMYPDLFMGTSYAQWVGPAPSAASADGDSALDATATAMSRDFVVVKCYLESKFADMSIAYDVIGLRGLYVYLLLPDGTRVPPSQTILGEKLMEESRAALRVFGRANLLVFPTKPSMLRVPAAGGPASEVRVVLEGYDSKFYFAWAPVLPPGGEKVSLLERPVVQRTQKGAQATGERLRDLSHRFD